MALHIDPPDLERRLQAAAAQQGVSAEQYLLEMVKNSLPPETGAVTGTPEPPPSQRIDVHRWLANFDAWVEVHARRDPLPENAFERGSFYPGGP